MATVREVIEKLGQFDPDMEVLTAKDEEGNGYNETSVSWIGTSMWNGEDGVNQSDIDNGWIDPEGFREVVVI